MIFMVGLVGIRVGSGRSLGAELCPFWRPSG
jgi:hypothetical protein